MTSVDWIAAGVIALAALTGLRRGLVGGVLGLAGIAAGAYFGAKLAPQFLSGSESPYTPLVALGGALVLVILLQTVAGMAGSAIRTSLFAVPPLRLLDSRRRARSSARPPGRRSSGSAAPSPCTSRGSASFARRCSARGSSASSTSGCRRRVSSTRSRASTRSSSIRGPEANVAPPNPALLASPGVKAARGSVFRVTGSACGLGVSGLGLGRGAEPRRHQRPRRRRR